MLRIAALVLPLVLLCGCEESKAPADDLSGSLTDVGAGESSGPSEVGEPRQNPLRPLPPSSPFSEFTSGSFDREPFQDFQGPFPGQFPSGPVPGAARPPGSFPGQFPSSPVPGAARPPGYFPGQFPSRPVPGAARPPGYFPGQFPSRPVPGADRPPGPYPGQFPSVGGALPANYPTRPFPGQRPPRPPLPYPGPFSEPAFGPLPLPTTLVNNAIHSISEFDEQRCVPRLLCELSSGSMPGVYSGGYYRPYRPQSESTFAGQEQLLQFLAALTLRNRDASPLAYFGGAALLGFSSRGRPDHCYKAFPECPHNQDALLDYLNNHRGGFFNALQSMRIFSGQNGPVPRPPLRPQRPFGPRPPFGSGDPAQLLGSQQPIGVQQLLSPRPLTSYNNANQGDSIGSSDRLDDAETNGNFSEGNIEARIQNKPERLLGTIDLVRPVYWRFPNNLAGIVPNNNIPIFPENQNAVVLNGDRKGYRKGKKQNLEVVNSPVNINHQQFNNPHQLPFIVPTLFPDRTGTGDLRLDNSELFGTGGRPDSGSGTRYGRVYFPKDVQQVQRPGEINTRYIVLFPGPVS